MKILIAEDEMLAAERLETLLSECLSELTVVDRLDSVRDLIQFFESGKTADLLLLDIQLADGKSFEAFRKVSIDVPIIFTTAFDEFALQAFKFHSIDYLLKPIQREDLQAALTKFEKFGAPKIPPIQELEMLREFLFPAQKKFKERFIIKSGNKLQYKLTHDVAYFFADGKEAYLVTRKDNRRFIIDHTLEELETLLDPAVFFRISRKFIVSIESISEVKGLISTKLELKLVLPCDHDLWVSRDRVHEFKTWLDH